MFEKINTNLKKRCQVQKWAYIHFGERHTTNSLINAAQLSTEVVFFSLALIVMKPGLSPRESPVFTPIIAGQWTNLFKSTL